MPFQSQFQFQFQFSSVRPPVRQSGTFFGLCAEQKVIILGSVGRDSSSGSECYRGS
ncbi:hypothetical protein BofuT4_P063100.1 [Botrytis cinerea T4]|uniref:Uncharacterized protein n=1 Tax=Botryotinia fuckeliana (strain T4) TaxID=999810 RepID=G2XTP4_BOTF4|nr:hypothetical protein BofuT4_P063100.1 [Botrytis cinerea T4]